MTELQVTLPALEETPPVVLFQVGEPGREPPGDSERWAPGAHDEEDIAQGVVVSNNEGVA